MTFTLPFLDALMSGLSSQFGFGVLAVLLGISVYILFSSLFGLDVVYSVALGGLPFVVYIINLGNQFFWLLGVLVIFYGIILWAAFKNVLRG